MAEAMANQITIPVAYLKQLEEDYSSLIRSFGTRICLVTEDECFTREVLPLKDLKEKYGATHRLSPYRL